jgi:hypothetical protein
MAPGVMEREPKPTPRRSARKSSATAPTAEAGGAVDEAKPAKKAPKNATPASARRFERPRGGPARAIADLMPDVGRTAFRRFGFVQSSVVTRWPEIVGERHAQVCAPEAIRFAPGERSDGILQLVVMPAHAPIIQHVVPEIIDRVNRFFGYNAVAKVKMRQGEVQKRPSIAAPKAPPSLRPIPIELGDSLRDIGDLELKAVLEALARSMIQAEEEAAKADKKRS